MKIIICIVLYNSKFSQSKALVSLFENQSYLTNVVLKIYLNGECSADLIINNGIFNIIDNHGKNLYLLENYKNCLQKAVSQHSEWVAFFDQDTEVTKEYLDALNNLTKLDKNCVASFPILKAQTKFVSPKTLFNGALFPSKVLKAGNYSNVDFLGLNSGSVYRVSFLKTIIDIAEEFHLDFIDYVFSHKVYKSGKSFNVMDVVLEHDMAVLNNQSLNKERARSILSAEYKYYRSYRGKFSFYLYKTKLLYKYFKSVMSKNYLYNKKILREFIRKVD